MWFDAKAELAKLGMGREAHASHTATSATSATQVSNVATVASVATPCDETNKALLLRDEAFKDLDAATDAANTLLERLRGCKTPAAVASFHEIYQPAIDALETHAAVRKIHIYNLMEYKKEQFR